MPPKRNLMRWWWQFLSFIGPRIWGFLSVFGLIRIIGFCNCYGISCVGFNHNTFPVSHTCRRSLFFSISTQRLWRVIKFYVQCHNNAWFGHLVLEHIIIFQEHCHCVISLLFLYHLTPFSSHFFSIGMHSSAWTSKHEGYSFRYRDGRIINMMSNP